VTEITPLADWLVVAPVLLCLGGGALLLMLRNFLRTQFWVCLAIILVIVAADALLLGRVMSEGPFAMTMGKWQAPFGITFAADAMGALFAFAAAIVTLVVVLYLGGDASEGAVRGGLYPLVLLLLGGVTGAFLTGDLFNLYVWFEVLLIASFGLIVLAGKPLQLDGAVKYGLLNFLATTLFLAGLGLFHGLVGTLNMADIILAAPSVDGAALTAVTALIALAFVMKAAAFPVQSWLPASYHTPPAAISALMGGLLTKVGVYALLRLLVLLLPGVQPVLAPTLFVVASLSAILGPLSAIAETNLRRAIGFILIGGVGVALLGVAAPNPTALAGSISYVVHSMLTLTLLYLVAGIIERRTGATDTRQMGQLYAQTSTISVVFIAALMGISGVPPFLGFWPKLQLLGGFIGVGDAVATTVILLNALLTLIAGARLWSHIFWRSAPGARAASPWQTTASTLALCTGIVLLGLWPAPLIETAQAAAAGLLDPSAYIRAVGLAP
jgi:multicomponent Na+:H+ antiporter subunit D